MKNLNNMRTLLMGLAMLSFVACSDDGGSDSTPSGGGSGGGGGSSVNKYSGSASYGDLVTFSIDKSAGTYSLTNETTGQPSSGSFDTRTDAAFNGIYQVIAQGDTFFGVELDDKIIAANFPSGNPSNDISFGVSSEIDNSGRLNEIAGDYVYVKLGAYLTQGSPMEWGVFTAGTDSIWGVAVDAGNNGPEDTTITRPLNYNNNDFTNRSFDFSYSVNNDRLNILGDGGSATGYVYAAGTTSVMLLDLGTGNGTAIAYKIDDNFNPTNAVGNYKFIDFATDGSKGAGNYSIDASGGVTYSRTEGSVASTVVNQTFNGQLQQSNIPNVWYAYNFNGQGDDIYMVVAGDAIMHYVFDSNGRFIEYGAGAQI